MINTTDYHIHTTQRDALDDVAFNPLNESVDCHHCGGAGIDINNQQCKKCNATGSISRFEREYA